MTAPDRDAVIDRVRAALADADRDDRPRPGRPALVALTGASEHQVRQALRVLDGHQPSRQRPADTTSSATSGTASPVARTPGDELAGGLETPGRQPGGHLVAVPSSRPPAPPAGGATSPAQPTTTSVTTTSAARAATNEAANTGAPAPGARLVAWLGFWFGALMSIAANVLHTWLPAATMPAGWAPGVAPQVGAAVWPIALLLSVEVLSRVAWRSGFWWWLARYGGAGTVALGSAVISYDHLKAVLLAWGYGHPGADVGPLVLDGLMIVSGFALLAMSRTTSTGATTRASAGA
ncbi:MAG TPA: hypothetical protein VGP26_24480 [Actinophytocola sp.]|jgi:hypothetical protein|nr:hypothetical protein [Actinophytocola sp.]